MGLLGAFACVAWSAEPLVAYRVVGDGIPTPLSRAAGNPARGQAIVVGRQSNCLLCHAVPGSGGHIAGNIGPSLAGVGGRLTEAQIRMRIVDPLTLNRDSIMPSYYRLEGHNRVAAEYRGRPVLDAQQIEDVVAYLRELQ